MLSRASVNLMIGSSHRICEDTASLRAGLKANGIAHELRAWSESLRESAGCGSDALSAWVGFSFRKILASAWPAGRGRQAAGGARLSVAFLAPATCSPRTVGLESGPGSSWLGARTSRASTHADSCLLARPRPLWPCMGWGATCSVGSALPQPSAQPVVRRTR